MDLGNPLPQSRDFQILMDSWVTPHLKRPRFKDQPSRGTFWGAALTHVWLENGSNTIDVILSHRLSNYINSHPSDPFTSIIRSCSKAIPSKIKIGNAAPASSTYDFPGWVFISQCTSRVHLLLELHVTMRLDLVIHHGHLLSRLGKTAASPESWAKLEQDEWDWQHDDGDEAKDGQGPSTSEICKIEDDDHGNETSQDEAQRSHDCEAGQCACGRECVENVGNDGDLCEDVSRMDEVTDRMGRGLTSTEALPQT